MSKSLARTSSILVAAVGALAALPCAAGDPVVFDRIADVAARHTDLVEQALQVESRMALLRNAVLVGTKRFPFLVGQAAGAGKSGQ